MNSSAHSSAHSTTRSLTFAEHGTPDVLSLRTTDLSTPAPDEALIAIHAASINPSDVKNVAGRMSQTTLPRTPGRDYSGVVIDGPAEWIGAQVWGSGGDVGFTRDGTHAEHVCVPVASLHRKPANLSHAQASAIGVNFITAWSAVVEAAQLKAGERVVIIGLGGVGGAAAQIARRIGARVTGLVRGLAPGATHRFADELIDSSSADVIQRVRDATHGGADVVFDTVGGSMFDTALPMLALRGRLVEISASDRREVRFDLADFYHNESRLIGVDSLKLDLIASGRMLESLRPGFEDGSYQPPSIAQVYRLEQAADAYRAVSAGTKGRVVLVMQGEHE